MPAFRELIKSFGPFREGAKDWGGVGWGGVGEQTWSSRHILNVVCLVGSSVLTSRAAATGPVTLESKVAALGQTVVWS